MKNKIAFFALVLIGNSFLYGVKVWVWYDQSLHSQTKPIKYNVSQPTVTVLSSLVLPGVVPTSVNIDGVINDIPVVGPQGMPYNPNMSLFYIEGLVNRGGNDPVHLLHITFK